MWSQLMTRGKNLRVSGMFFVMCLVMPINLLWRNSFESQYKVMITMIQGRDQ